MAKLNLDGATAVVSGVTGGLGHDIAEILIKEHNCTVIGIARNREKAEKFAESLGEFSGKFICRFFDVGEKSGWTELSEWMKLQNINPDIIINNAGILPRFDKFTHYTDDQIEKVMNTNFFSCVYAAQEMLPLLQKSSCPAFVNISSSAALAPLPGTAIYSASKGAVKNFTECLREENVGKLYVGLVCPGFTRTDIFRYQEGIDKSSVVYLVATGCRSMANKIVRGIIKKKKRMVFGFDAKFMDGYTRIASVRSLRVYMKVMKLSGIELFRHVFEEDTD